MHTELGTVRRLGRTKQSIVTYINKPIASSKFMHHWMTGYLAHIIQYLKTVFRY